MSIISRISDSAARHPDRIALFARGTEYTFSELVAAANGIRELLKNKGSVAGQRVAIMTGDDLETYASLLAVWSVGCTFVPVNANNPVDRSLQIIRQADTSFLLTSRPSCAVAKALVDRSVSVETIQTQEAVTIGGQLVFERDDDSDLAYIMFTSGSTGTPKGVPISHGNLAAFVSAIVDQGDLGFSQDDRFLQMFELTFDLSVMCTFVPWCIGAAVYVVPETGIGYLNVVDVLQSHDISVALMVPSILNYLSRYFTEIRFPAVRLSMFCGEPLIHDVVKDWAQCVPNARIENVYGPTEATIYCTAFQWDEETSAAEQFNGVVAIGKSIPGVEAFVMGEDGKVARRGEKGELCILGDQVMAGYWRDPDKTAQAMVEIDVDGRIRPAYKSGDTVFVNDNGNLAYCGRQDSQVKIDGHRIELGEIESYARTYLGHAGAVVVTVPDASGQSVLRLVVAAPDLDRKELNDFLAAKLPSYMLPKQMLELPELPLNMNGKVDRAALSRLDA